MIPNARKLGEPIQSAIPLHPPYHPSEPRATCPIGKEYLRSSHCSLAMNSTGEGTFSVVSGKVCFQLDRSLQYRFKEISARRVVKDNCTNQSTVLLNISLCMHLHVFTPGIQGQENCIKRERVRAKYIECLLCARHSSEYFTSIE